MKDTNKWTGRWLTSEVGKLAMASLLWLCTGSTLMAAEKKVPERNANAKVTVNTKRVNFGIKAGFNSSMIVVTDFNINGSAINDMENNYKLGYFGSAFMRINMKKHFIQPELMYNVSKGEVRFVKPLDVNNTQPQEPEYAWTHSTIHSLDIPLLYGYNIVKNGPYAMAVFGGPKLRWFFNRLKKLDYVNLDEYNWEEELRPVNVSFLVGVAVTISHVFFDFRYEHGLNNFSKGFTTSEKSSRMLASPELPGNRGPSMTFKRMEQVLSVSLGVIF